MRLTPFVFALSLAVAALAEGAAPPAVTDDPASSNTGFDAHIGLEIAAADAVGRENVARYLCRPPVVLGRIVAQDSA